MLSSSRIARSCSPNLVLTLPVLDSTSGKPAPDLRVRLDRLQGQTFVVESQSCVACSFLRARRASRLTTAPRRQTDSDGRCSNLLAPSTRLETGIYKITFYTSEYFTARGISSFYPFVEVRSPPASPGSVESQPTLTLYAHQIPFEVKIAEEHYHVPLLLAPYSYSTYRGS